MANFIYYLITSLCLNLSHGQVPTEPAPSGPTTIPWPVVTPPAPPPDPKTSPTTQSPTVVTPSATPNVTGPAASAGSSSAPAALNSITNSVQPAVPGANPTGNPAVPAASASAPGKYAEFQSICRTKDYETPAYYSEELKNLRLSMIKAKMKDKPQLISLHLRLLQELIDQRKIDQVQQTLQEIKAKNISQSERNMAEASMAILKGDKKSARDLLNKVLAENPKNIDALKMLADVFAKDSNYYETTAIYLDLAKITGRDYNEELCESYTLDTHYSDAEGYCFRGITKNKSAYASIFLGVGAREQQKMKVAKKYFSDSLKMKDTEMGYVCLGEIQVSEKLFSTAISTFKLGVVKFPKSDRAHVALAWALFTDKQRMQALEQFQKACSLNRRVVVEVRKTLKILIDEKSSDVSKYSLLLQSCESL